MAISFDFEKVFYRLWRYKILITLQQCNIKGNMAKFSDRPKFRVGIEESLFSTHTQENGTPQDTIISTILFIIAITDLAKLIKPPVKHVIFADDLTIYMTAYNIDTLTEILKMLYMRY